MFGWLSIFNPFSWAPWLNPINWFRSESDSDQEQGQGEANSGSSTSAWIAGTENSSQSATAPWFAVTTSGVESASASSSTVDQQSDTPSSSVTEQTSTSSSQQVPSSTNQNSSSSQGSSSGPQSSSSSPSTSSDNNSDAPASNSSVADELITHPTPQPPSDNDENDDSTQNSQVTPTITSDLTVSTLFSEEKIYDIEINNPSEFEIAFEILEHSDIFELIGNAIYFIGPIPDNEPEISLSEKYTIPIKLSYDDSDTIFNLDIELNNLQFIQSNFSNGFNVIGSSASDYFSFSNSNIQRRDSQIRIDVKSGDDKIEFNDRIGSYIQIDGSEGNQELYFNADAHYFRIDLGDGSDKIFFANDIWVGSIYLNSDGVQDSIYIENMRDGDLTIYGFEPGIDVIYADPGWGHSGDRYTEYYKVWAEVRFEDIAGNPADPYSLLDQFF